MEDRHSISLESVFTVYDTDDTFKFKALQTEGEKNCPVRFCSRQLPQSIAVILRLLIFYNMNVHVQCL